MWTCWCHKSASSTSVLSWQQTDSYWYLYYTCIYLLPTKADWGFHGVMVYDWNVPFVCVYQWTPSPITAILDILILVHYLLQHLQRSFFWLNVTYQIPYEFDYLAAGHPALSSKPSYHKRRMPAWRLYLSCLHTVCSKKTWWTGMQLLLDTKKDGKEFVVSSSWQIRVDGLLYDDLPCSCVAALLLLCEYGRCTVLLNSLPLSLIGYVPVSVGQSNQVWNTNRSNITSQETTLPEMEHPKRHTERERGRNRVNGDLPFRIEENL